MPNAVINAKKFLDANGLAYFASKLNNYPDNTVLEAVVEGVQDALDEKLNISDRGAANGVASLDANGIVPVSQLPAFFKHDTYNGWRANATFIPAEGEIIVYTDKAVIEENGRTVTVPGIKVGDGSAYGIDLPFLGEKETEQVLNALISHINDTDAHITSAERVLWNNKLNCILSGEVLEFNRS